MQVVTSVPESGYRADTLSSNQMPESPSLGAKHFKSINPQIAMENQNQLNYMNYSRSPSLQDLNVNASQKHKHQDKDAIMYRNTAHIRSTTSPTEADSIGLIKQRNHHESKQISGQFTISQQVGAADDLYQIQSLAIYSDESNVLDVEQSLRDQQTTKESHVKISTGNRNHPQRRFQFNSLTTSVADLKNNQRSIQSLAGQNINYQDNNLNGRKSDAVVGAPLKLDNATILQNHVRVGARRKRQADKEALIKQIMENQNLKF